MSPVKQTVNKDQVLLQAPGTPKFFPQENFHENGKGDACLEIDLGPCRVQNFRGYIFAVERTRGGDLTH